MLHHEHEHCCKPEPPRHDHWCKPEPPKREQPPYCGKVNTAGMGEYYSAHACPPHPCPPHPGYVIPPVKPLFVPGMSTQEQIAVIAGKVDEMCNLMCEYDKKVWGAYDEIVHACICNDAYYSEIATEVGYITATSAKYTVVKIPFVDNANQPIRLQLGLAYNNTTNSGLHENVFDASERVLADKLFPATNIADEWTGNVYWKGAPLFANPGVISEARTNDEIYTLGVLRNGFIKVYNKTATQADMNKDDVENAMGVIGVLINGGKKTPESYGYTDGTTGMVGIGMNYDTQERFFILVDGTAATGVDTTGGCTADQLADLFAKLGCTVAVLLAHSESTCGLDCGEMLTIPYDTNHIPYVPQLNAFWYITKEEHYHNDYVREVAELMQKYGRSIWTGVINGKTLDAVRAELADVESQLAQEIQDRKDGDNVLDEKISALGERVTNLYNELVAADTALGKRIDKEIEDRKQAVADEATARDEAVKAEAQAREEAVKAEAQAREEADNELKQSDVNINGKITQLQQSISDEATAREQADAQLQHDIATEAESRKTADDAITEALNTLKADYNAFKTSTNTDLETKTNQINQILADISSVKNLIAGVQATQSEIDETLTTIQNALTAMEKSFENLKQTVANLQTSWETYKETMNAQYTAFVDTVEKALSDMDKTLREWVTEQLGNYVPLAGTADDKPVTGEIVVQRGTINSPGFTSRTLTSTHETNIYPGKITINSGDGNHNSADITVELGSAEAPTSVKFTDPARSDELSNVSIASPRYASHGATKKYVDDKKSEYDENYYSLTPTAPMSEAWIRTAESDTTGAIIEASGDNVLKVRGVNNSTTNVRIENVADPVNDQDAVTKKYLEQHTLQGEYIPLTGTETDKPVTGNIEFKPADVTRAGGGGGGVSSFTLGGISQYGHILGCFDFTNSKIVFDGSNILFMDGNSQIQASFESSKLSFLDNTDDSKVYNVDFNTGKSGRITFQHYDKTGDVPSIGSVELDGINTISMVYSDTDAIPTIKATSANTITLSSVDSNVSNDLTLTGLAAPVNEKDATNKKYVDTLIITEQIVANFPLGSKEATDEYFVYLGSVDIPKKTGYRLVNVLLTESAVSSSGPQEISNTVLLTNTHVTKQNITADNDAKVDIFGMLQHDVADITPVLLTNYTGIVTATYVRL